MPTGDRSSAHLRRRHADRVSRCMDGSGPPVAAAFHGCRTGAASERRPLGACCSSIAKAIEVCLGTPGSVPSRSSRPGRRSGCGAWYCWRGRLRLGVAGRAITGLEPWVAPILQSGSSSRARTAPRRPRRTGTPPNPKSRVSGLGLIVRARPAPAPRASRRHGRGLPAFVPVRVSPGVEVGGGDLRPEPLPTPRGEAPVDAH